MITKEKSMDIERLPRTCFYGENLAHFFAFLAGGTSLIKGPLTQVSVILFQLEEMRGVKMN